MVHSTLLTITENANRKGIIMDSIIAILGALFMILVIVACVRVMIKKQKGDAVHITPVGVNRDLPGSVTGLNKYKQ